MTRTLFVVAVAALIIGSLLSFPAHIAWTAFLWVVPAFVSGLRNRAMWPWLLSCICIFAAKTPGLTVEYWFLSLVFTSVACIDFAVRRKSGQNSSRIRVSSLTLALVLALVVFGFVQQLGTNTSRRPVMSQRPVACLGDSLTDFGYPEELQKLLSVPVADFGVNGITTDEGLELVPEILASDPQAVVIELGGHDYNSDKKSRGETKANLERLVLAFLDRDIEVILVQIPRGFISDPYAGIERELASRYDLQMIDDSVIRSFVFCSPIIPPGSWLAPEDRLSEDGLHPNENGNRYFADVVRNALVSVYGKAIER